MSNSEQQSHAEGILFLLGLIFTLILSVPSCNYVNSKTREQKLRNVEAEKRLIENKIVTLNELTNALGKSFLRQ